MLIRNYDSDYIVVKHVQSMQSRELYLCHKLHDSAKKEYDVLCIKDVELCRKMIEHITKEVDTKKFVDFVEFFTFQGNLVLVFVHYSGVALTQKLSSEKCPFMERLEMAHNLLEHMVYLHMPLSFQIDALELDHIMAVQGQEIQFQYGFSQMERWSQCKIQEVGTGVNLAFRQLFATELEQMTCPELEQFLKWLLQGEYRTYLDIYEAFGPCYEALKAKTEEDLAAPHTRAFRIWEKLKIIGKWLKRILMVLILLGALIYLTISLGEYLFPSESDGAIATDRFDYIGTVQIQDGTVINGN